MRGSIPHSTAMSSELQDILRVLALLAVFIALTSAIVLALSAWLRVGFAQPTELFALALLQLAATVTAPHLFVRLGIVRSASLLGLAPISMLFIPLLGFFLPYWILVSTLALLAVVGFGLAIRSLRFSVVGVISTLICTVTFAVWIVLHYNADLDMPILAPELALTGTLKRDGYFHAALTHLIMHNGFPSTGVDGLKPLLLYHTAVHYWVAALAKVTGTAPLLAFPVASQGLMIPLALFALGFAVAASAQVSGRLKLIAVIIALSGYVAFEQFVQNSFPSTSMLFAMVFFFLAFPTLYPIFTTHSSSRRETWVAAGLTVLFLPVKVSLAVMWIMSLAYASVRRSALPPRSQLGLLALFGVVFIALCLLVRTETFLEWDNPPFHFFTHYDMGRYLFPLAVPFLLVTASLIENRVTSWDKLTALVLDGGLLVAEISVVLSGAALVIAVIGVFPRSIPYYFILTVGWFAWPPLVIALMRQIAAMRPDSIAAAKDTWINALMVGPAQLAMIAVAVLGPLTLLMGLTTAKPILDPFYRQRTALSYELGLPIPSRKGFDWDAVRARHVFPPELGEATRQGLGQRFANDAHRLAGSGSKVAVFAPPDNAAFWSLVRPCEAKSLFIPAVTGLPMLLGMPPKSMTECMKSLIWYSQRRQYGDAHTREMSRAELCAHARQRDIDRVIVLGKEQSELIACSQ